MNFLRLLFPEVRRARIEISNISIEFYNSQRRLHYPELPDHIVSPDNYQFEWFVQDMERSRQRFTNRIDNLPEDTPQPVRQKTEQQAILDAQRSVARSLENSGRTTLQHAVDTDDALEPEPDDDRTQDPDPDPDDIIDIVDRQRARRRKAVKGWARVATGRETCSWCLVMISRGPVYSNADTAGLDIDDDLALEMFEQGKPLDDYMTQWHPNCDCKVVPVFSYTEWPGRDQAAAALEAWKQFTKGYHGQDALNAFRRAVERGDVNVPDYAAA